MVSVVSVIWWWNIFQFHQILLTRRAAETLWPLRGDLWHWTARQQEHQGETIDDDEDILDMLTADQQSPGGERMGRWSGCVNITSVTRTRAPRWRSMSETVSLSTISTGRAETSLVRMVHHRVSGFSLECISASPRTMFPRVWARECSCMLTFLPRSGSLTSWWGWSWGAWRTSSVSLQLIPRVSTSGTTSMDSSSLRSKFQQLVTRALEPTQHENHQKIFLETIKTKLAEVILNTLLWLWGKDKICEGMFHEPGLSCCDM